MADHKENCPWKNGYRRSLTSRDPNGPDSFLAINDAGIEYDHNLYTNDKEDEEIPFDYCPKCGVRLTEGEEETPPDMRGWVLNAVRNMIASYNPDDWRLKVRFDEVQIKSVVPELLNDRELLAFNQQLVRLGCMPA